MTSRSSPRDKPLFDRVHIGEVKRDIDYDREDDDMDNPMTNRIKLKMKAVSPPTRRKSVTTRAFTSGKESRNQLSRQLGSMHPR
jgi:hypothetical protein